MRWFLAALMVVSLQAAADTLTFTQGTNMAAAVSPDGRQTVIDLQGTLWLMPSGGGTAKPITDRLADARQPQWAPDGSKIVFQGYGDGGWHIYTVAPDGSGLTQLTRGGFDNREPVYSPDGHWIAFSSDRDATYAIWVMAADGSEPRLLTITPSNEYAPTWSPDGKRIAYASDRSDGPGIYSITFDGLGERLMAPLDGTLAGLSWSKDGKSIAFVERTALVSRLKIMDASSTVVADIAAAGDDVFPFRAAWLADGGLMYTAAAGLKRLPAVRGKVKPTDVAFAAEVEIARPSYARKSFDFTSPEPRPVKGVRGPRLSPDGARVLFTALGDVWLADVTRAGSRPQRLTNDPAVDFDAGWAADGKSIVFVSDRTGKTQLWRRDVSSGAERQLTNLAVDVLRPAISPDGTRIAFFTAQGLAGLGNAALQLLDVASGEVRQLRAGLFAPGQVSWSPDGRFIALSALAPGSSRFREGFSQFLVISVDDGASKDRFVTPHPDRSLAMRGDDGPVWSPDGSSFAYVFDGRLWIVPITREGDLAGPPQRLNAELTEAPSWSGDGRFILYNATDHLVRIGRDGKTKDVHPRFTWSHDIPADKYVLRTGRLFDGIAPAYVENMDILIAGHRIAEIVPRREWPARMRIIDVSDKAVIPGLMESHTHQSALFGERLGRLWLAMGVTSVREPGADPYEALERREAWSTGRRLGPREFFAGALTDGPRTYYGFANSIASAEHLDLEMTRAKQLDFDMIKTYVRMPDAMQQTIVERAHAIGIPVSSHEIYPAAGYNVDAVEHLRGSSRRGYSPKQSEMGFSYGDVVDILSRTGMTVTPTIGLYGGFNALALSDPEFLLHPVYVALFREDERKSLAAAVERSRAALPATTRMVAAMQKAVREIVTRGGRITSGTDSPFVPYGLSFQAELELAEAAGLAPYQVLLSATAWAAERLGLENHLGTLKPGLLADMAVIDGDPLARIRDVRAVAAVVSNGRYLTRAELVRDPKTVAPAAARE